jgi:hypothetical protein
LAAAPLALHGCRCIAGGQQRVTSVRLQADAFLGFAADLGQLLGGLLDAPAPFDGLFAEHEIRKAAVVGAVALQGSPT